MQWSFQIERAVGEGLVVETGYSGSRGIHEPFRMDDMNSVLPEKTAAGYLWPENGTKINAAFGRMSGLMWQADSYYHGWKTRVARRMGGGLAAQAAFTWSKSMDTQSAFLAGDALTNAVLNPPWYDTRLNRGLSDFHAGRVLTGSVQWRVPRTHGFEVGSLWVVSDGTPFTPLLGGDAVGQRSVEPTTVPDRVAGPGCGTAVNAGTPNRYVRVECFAVPKPVRLRGNSGRNVLTGPGLATVDLYAMKGFGIPGAPARMRVEVRLELFNALNRANFAVPAGVQLFNPDGSAIGSGGGDYVDGDTVAAGTDFAAAGVVTGIRMGASKTARGGIAW